MQSMAINLEFKLNVNLRLVKPDFMQSTAVNLEFKLKVIFKLLSCNRPLNSTKHGPNLSTVYALGSKSMWSISIANYVMNVSQMHIPTKTSFPKAVDRRSK